MTNGISIAWRGGARWRLPVARPVAWPLAMLASLLLIQFSLIFAKSFNWDEFLHFSMVYQLHDGTLARPFQSLLARILYWAPYLSDDLIVQMLAARIFAWSAFLVGLGALYGLARQFVSREDAAWTTLVYLAAGNVYVHAFAIRTDPIAMAVLMLALYLLASRRVSWIMALAVGVLVGFAGMLTLKAVFYAPCFAGVAWLRLSQADDKRRTLTWIAAIVPTAAATFGAIYLVHSTGLAPIPEPQRDTVSLAHSLQWLTQGLIRQPKHTLIAFATAPVLVYALFKAPSAWRESRASRDRIVALAGLCLPLVVILFYRNVFPYFFVYILAPVCVGLAPAVAQLRQRYGSILIAASICAIPLIKFAIEPRDVLERQRALISYVHREFPAGTIYFDYCGIIADYPRVVDHLVSGVGLANYRERGIPLVAKAVENGQLPFVIDNSPAISMALVGKTSSGGLLPADVAALHGNYVRAWGDLWLAGEEIPRGADPVAIDIPTGGAYTADSSVSVDGVAYRRGDIVELTAGSHIVHGSSFDRTILWRGGSLPAQPQISFGPLFTEF